jgi:MFS family permease
MTPAISLPKTLQQLSPDARLVFLTRFIRLFSYGALSVVLVFYLTGLGLNESQVGLLLTLTLLGDTAVSLWLTTRADRAGRRRMLIAGSLLMAGAGATFALTQNMTWLVVAGTIGVLSPSGNEVGPFLPIEQAALAQVVPAPIRTEVFAWFTLTGAMATASGSLFAGLATSAMEKAALPPISSQRNVIFAYAVLGLILALLFQRLSMRAEVHSGTSEPSRFGISASRNVVLKLSALFALDAFGGSFVVQSFAAYWFYLRFGVGPAALGGIFFGANILAGLSALVASRLAARFGLVRTMVFTHLPSNVLLMLVPLMPNAALATAVLFARFSISQMDVPTRQSFMMAIVRPEERSATGGIANVARTTGAAIGPLLAGMLFANPKLINLPFFIAGTLKIAYDLALYRAFIRVAPPEESAV